LCIYIFIVVKKRGGNGERKESQGEKEPGSRSQGSRTIGTSEALLWEGEKEKY